MMGRTRKKGFTIVELLTVMGVIAVLIGLMVPALALVKDYSKRIQQKAQFHGIDMGLQMFKTEFGSFPQSSENKYDADTDDTSAIAGNSYCGANKLAEAMVGLDLIGFHPSSAFRGDGYADVALNTTPASTGTVRVYNAETDQDGIGWQTAVENMDARKGPFVDLEKVNAFHMDEIYASGNLGNFSNTSNIGASTTIYPLVLCDVYAQKRTGIGSRKTGTPILYYRAHNNFKFQDASLESGNDPGDQADDDIYSYYDNQELLDLGMPDGIDRFTVTDETIQSRMLNFDDMIVNQNVQTIRRPYRADSYILISAGKDGDFGTADDVFNFDKEIIE